MGIRAATVSSRPEWVRRAYKAIADYTVGAIAGCVASCNLSAIQNALLLRFVAIGGVSSDCVLIVLISVTISGATLHDLLKVKERAWIIGYLRRAVDATATLFFIAECCSTPIVGIASN